METMAVIDFETTGLMPAYGDRATEIAAVLVRDGQIVDRYHSLMNTGHRIPPFIEHLTGITNAMVRKAPPAEQVMAEVADFVGTLPLVAHNASFDRKFWDAELERIDRRRSQDFVCSMLVAKRVFPQAPSYKLGALIDLAGLPAAGRAHRALADAEMATHLTLHLQRELMQRFGLSSVPHALLGRIQKTPKNQLEQCVKRSITSTGRPVSAPMRCSDV
ncbi:3'-5' exonuclease [Thiorhodococcus mannitoliphagus]|uniref:3'-5' exonuclease n=1 Tax=Thiorhodococcus mannitoliphagus TaxID=329406 RepID=A0A6P1DSN9_9GAMM|nr:3'-5' exonuclease [Thiorhodococcus mannitoliphagus]NEX19951.1 3'-5' exonuclease [Thiorhodococcus mannitoliphagus]